MNQNRQNNDRIGSTGKVQYFSAVITVGIILAMLAYLFLTTYSTTKLAENTEIISEHPFEVTTAAGEIKSAVLAMQIRCERLTKHNGEADIRLVEAALDKRGISLDASVAIVEERYLGNAEDVEELKALLARLTAAQAAYVDFAGKTTDLLQIEQHLDEHLTPLYQQVDDQVEKIVTFAQNAKVRYGEMAEELREVTQIGSVILILLMIGGLVVSQLVLHRQKKELLRRSLLFDNLSRSIDDAFLIQNGKTGKIYYTSLNISRVLGHEVNSIEDVYQGFDPESRAEITETTGKAEFVSPFIKEVQCTLRGGEKRWISVRIYRVTEVKTPQLISVFADCTQEKQSRQALHAAIANAEQANEAKTVFLSRMSHEIRTPLNAIIGMTTLADMSINNPEKVQYHLEKIGFSSKHLLMLINDVLDMSKIESNKLILQKEPFDLFQLVNTFASSVYAQAKEKGIEFTETAQGFDGQAQYLGDPLRLNQILMNLSSNALKFTSPGGRIALEVKRINFKSTIDIVRFVLTDTGIGMSKESLERVFKPFEQANASIATRFGGTGLGMSITKNLVSLSGGKIDIQSEEGVGTSCTVDLPFQRDMELKKQPDFVNSSLRALVVDDEQKVCEETAALLNRMKVETDWSLTGREAIAKLLDAQRQERPFDVCLIDWQMPEMDGIQITHEIRAKVGSELPIIMISAYDYSEIEEEARTAGANAFLPKPLYRSSVFAAIQSTLFSDESEASSAPKFSSLNGRRLLLAEDNEINREIAVELLSVNDLEIECAANGQEALQMFLKAPSGYYDAILMDVQMPIMDGHEATRRLRASNHPDAKHIPVIATTANAFNEDVSIALTAGMNAHVAKPIDFDVLSRLLVKLLNEKRPNVENG